MSLRPYTHDELATGTDAASIDRLVRGACADPHAILGVHDARIQGRRGALVRAFEPRARRIQVTGLAASPQELSALGSGLFATFIPHADASQDYRLEFEFEMGVIETRHDPYRFQTSLPESAALASELERFSHGEHRRIFELLGAHPIVIAGTPGISFRVWAPSATRVSVVGDFSSWDGRTFQMRSLGVAGLWELFLPELRPDTQYAYEIRGWDGRLHTRADPVGTHLELRAMENPWMHTRPLVCTRVEPSALRGADALPFQESCQSSLRWADPFRFSDEGWLADRKGLVPARSAISILRLDLRAALQSLGEGATLDSPEVRTRLIDRIRGLGFSHVEISCRGATEPEADASPDWLGCFALPNAYGSTDSIKAWVDGCHRERIGVLLGWSPAHFPEIEGALRHFDGAPLYELEEPGQPHQDRTTKPSFDFGRPEVRGFLISSAIYWLTELHFDGLHIEGLEGLLYQSPAGDSRRRGVAHENPDAVEFFRALNRAVHEETPGSLTIAEDTSAWPRVTHGVSSGGLGFDLKDNVVWAEDTLHHLQRAPIHRPYHQAELGFAMRYEYQEHFVNPLHSVEVFAPAENPEGWLAHQLMLMTYQFTRPGKPTLSHPLRGTPERAAAGDSLPPEIELALERFLRDLSQLYARHACFWIADSAPNGFAGVTWENAHPPALAYFRFEATPSDEEPKAELPRSEALVVLNPSNLGLVNHCIGVPRPVAYRIALATPDYMPAAAETWAQRPFPLVPEHAQGHAQSVCISMPSVSALVLFPEE